MKKPIRAVHGKDRNNYEQVLDRTHDILNGGVNLGAITGLIGGTATPGNIDAAHAQVVSPGAPATDFAVTHNLGRVPTGFIVVNKDQNANIWRGTVAWTTTTITLQASLATVTMTVLIY
jgi:hypothetical protein